MASENFQLATLISGNQYHPVPQEIQEFADRNNFSVIHVNGQRYSTPKANYEAPDGNSYVPPKGCEVFIGKLPRDCFEPEILPIFARIGPIYRFRLMMDFSGTNRGYAFVQFYNQETANMSVQLLNNFQIRPKRRIRMLLSVENCRLLLTGVPQYKTAKEIYFELRSLVPGLLHVTVDKNRDLPRFCSASRGFACIVYSEHHLAAQARSKMLVEPFHMWGYRVKVDWAEPILTPYYWEEVLRVRNLPRQTLTETIRTIFNQTSYQGVEKIIRMDYDHSSVVFIYFRTRAQAEMAKGINDNSVVEGNVISVSWFNPRHVPGASNRNQPRRRAPMYANPQQPTGSHHEAMIATVDQHGFWTYVPCTDPSCPYYLPPPSSFRVD